MPTYLAEVVRARELTARMRRITVGGNGLAGFAGGRSADERIKLLIPVGGEPLPALPAFADAGVRFAPGAPRPAIRTLTTRAFDGARGELAIDVAIHPGGVASDWALRARPGDRIGIAGPCGGYRPPRAAYQLLAGDEAALPAIATILERLPADARAHVLVEVEDAADQLALVASRDARVSLTWLHRHGIAPGEQGLLAAAVRELSLPTCDVAVWAAGEAGAMRAIRRHLRDELRLPRDAFHVAGYWRRRLSEDEAIVADRQAVETARAAGGAAEEIEDAGIY